MADSETKAGTWFAGDAAGLDADYAHVVRRVTRLPSGKWGDGDEGDSEPVAIAQSAELRDTIIADHNAALNLEAAAAERDALVRVMTEFRAMRKWGTALDFTDKWTLDNATPDELISMTRPAHLWRKLVEVLNKENTLTGEEGTNEVV